MQVDLSKKEISLLLVLLNTAGSSTDYWQDFADHPAKLMAEQGIKTGHEAGQVSDNIYSKLRERLQ